MSLVYSAVASGHTVIYEYGNDKNQYKGPVVKLLQLFDSKKQYVFSDQGKYYIMGTTPDYKSMFLCCAKAQTEQGLTKKFLDEFVKAWQSKYGKNSKNYERIKNKNEFDYDIEKIFNAYNDPKQQKLMTIQQNISIANDTMTQCLTEALNRGDTLVKMDQNANAINETALQFKKTSASVRRRLCCQHCQWYIIGIIGLIFAGWLVASLVCGFTFGKC